MLPCFLYFLSGRRYIADSPTLVTAAVGCALLLGHEAKTLKENPSGEDSRWSWDRLRRLLTPAFAEAMLAFDPRGTRPARRDRQLQPKHKV